MVVCYSRQYMYTVVTPTFTYTCILLGVTSISISVLFSPPHPTPLPFHLSPCFQHHTVYVHVSVVMYSFIHRNDGIILKYSLTNFVLGNWFKELTLAA